MSDALAIKVEQPPAPAGDGAVVLGMIDRLLARPDVPVEKLEQMLALHQKLQADAARKAFLAAFAQLQSALPAATRKGEGHNKKAYARYEDVANALREPFAQHGFSHWFSIDQTSDRVKITTCLGHRDGHVETTSMLLPFDTSGNKTPMHAFGSTVSYGKRYGLLTITGIATEDDDDGKRAVEVNGTATLDEINALIEETKSNRVWFLERYSVETMEDLTGKQRDEIKTLLQAKQAKMRKAKP